MSNYCSNELKVEGPAEVLAEFVAFAEGPDPGMALLKYGSLLLQCDKFVPIPQSVLKGEGDQSPADWANANWGTKGIQETERNYVPGETIALYSFESSWGAPNYAAIAMIERFPALSFQLLYSERGCDFSGILEGRDGDVTNEAIGDFGAYHGETDESDASDDSSD